jgi:hypothetical protein
MTTFSGSPLTPLTVGASPIYAQSFCTLAELDEDLNLLGSEREARVIPKIKTASDFLMKNIGWFAPVTMTLNFNGLAKSRLYVSPLLEIDQVVNDEVILGAADFIAQPEAKYWPNGPYAWLDVAPEAVNLSAWEYEENGISITGKWGLYNLAQSLGVTTGASQAADALTIQVSNGAKVSPGMIVKIGSEQEYIESTSAPLSTITTLSAAIADSEAQTISLTNGALVNVGEIIRVGVEQIKITDLNGNTAAVVRGWNRTIKSSHLINANVDVYRVFDVTRAVNGTTAAVHDSASGVYRQCVPDDINMLCRKMAGRMLKDAQGGFSGVIGDPMMGTAQYLYILPKELEDVRKSYRIIHVAR